ncbi:TetR/AcrR family transcriptional regulator [Gordonia iterans]
MTSENDVPDEAPALFDPDKLGVTPQTERGRRTRSALIAAARRVFERDGFVDSRLVDIVAEANCSIGSFYTWFESKDEVFAAVLHEAQSDMMHPGTGRIEETDDPVAIIAASNRAYFEAYRRNARLNHLLQQVAAVDPRFRAMRIARTNAFVARNARAIADLQSRGLADRRVEAELAATALSGMISRLAYDTYVIAGDDAPDEGLSDATDRLVESATRMWTNALGLTTPELRAD